MSLPDSAPATGFSRNRRTLIGLGGAGLLAGIGGYVAWFQPQKPAGKSAATAKAAGTSTTGFTTTATESEAPAAQAAAEITAFSAAIFQPHLNSEFLAVGDTTRETATCRLIEVSPETRQETFKGTWESFTLLFKTSPGFLADGSLCRVTHPRLGAMELFLSPVGKSDLGLLQAAFSRQA